MRIKRILAALMVLAISAGAFSVPAFAYTGESATAESTEVVTEADTTATETEDSVVQNENENTTEADAAKETDSIDLSDLDLPVIPGMNTDFYVDLLKNLDPEVIGVLLKNPKLLAYFLPTLHVTVTGTSVTIAVDSDPQEEATTQTGTVKTNGSNLNVRTGPGIGYDIISSLANGSEIEITGEENGWYQIVFPAKFAYVCGQYVELNAVPTTPAPEGYTFDIDGAMLANFLSAFSYLFEDEPIVQETHGLTPHGNLGLVDDIGSATGEGQQFVTLVTKAGNYFYLIIDRDEKGNENVHFLNQVDEADLFSLMDEDEAAAIKEQLAEEEAARQQETQPVITPTEPTESEEGEQEQQPAQKSKLPYAMGLIVLLCGCAAGGAFFLMKNKKQKAANDHPDPDADYREDDDGYDIPEEADDAEEYDDSEEY